MFVLVWIGQILLFFILWKLFHLLTGLVRQSFESHSLLADLIVNVVVAILLLIFVSDLHSVWWQMSLIGAVVGVITGMTTNKPAKH